MKRRTGTDDQYEPLIAPQGWNGDERRFAIRLGMLLDTLFQRTGTLHTAARAHPVGSVYLCASGADPARLFGGVWEAHAGAWPEGVTAWQRTA